MKRFTVKIITLLLLVMLMMTCDYEFPKAPYPRVETISVSDITENGVTFTASVLQLSAQPIINHGFVWGENQNLFVNEDDHVELGATDKTGNFDIEVTTGFVVGQHYYVKAFLITATKAIYGEAIEFTSLGSSPPVITNFTPESGILMDTITIRGQGFSFRSSQNIVRFGEVDSEVISASDSLIRAIVPLALTNLETQISVEIANSTSTFSQKFTLLPPQIREVAENEIEYCKPLNFLVSNFPQGQLVTVHFSDQSSQAQVINQNELQVVVPSFLRNKGSIEPIVNIGNFSLQSGKQLLLREPAINLDPDLLISFYDTLTINYTNLGNCQLRILSEDNTLPTFDQDENSVKVRIPADIDHPHLIPLQILIGGEAFFNGTFQRQLATSSVTPSSAKPGDHVRIDGRGYQPIADRNYIYFAPSESCVTTPECRIQCEIIESSARHIIFKVPENVEDFTNPDGNAYLGIFTQNIGSIYGLYDIEP